MSCPSSSTSPSTRVFGMMSFMRFKQRRYVDFPQPDGPMRAVTDFSGIASEMSWSAWFFPEKNESLLVSIRVFKPAGKGPAGRGGGGEETSGTVVIGIEGEPGSVTVIVPSFMFGASFRAAG